MMLKPLIGFSFENLPVQVADEAFVFDILISCGFQVTQLGKGVDDNTEDDVQQNCDHDQEETKIVHTSEIEPLEIGVSCRLGWKEFTNTTTSSQSVVNSRTEAVEHGLAHRVSLSV